MVCNRPTFILRLGPFALASMMLATMFVNVFAFSVDSRTNPATSKLSFINTMSYKLGLKSKRNTRNWMKINTLYAVGANTNDEEAAATSSAAAVGLYKKFADHAVEQLLETGWLKNDDTVPLDLSEKQAPARGSKTESIVRVTTQALIPKTNNNNSDDNDDENKQLVRYARITLLETVPVSSEVDGTVSTDGIQVLNFVVLPNADTTLPILGIDLVSLPGSRHLLLLDAQPMAVPNPHESHWEEWYNKHVRDSVDHPEKIGDEPLKYAWGGDFPETVKQYVSKYALWTRLQNLSEDTSTDHKPSDDKTMSKDTSTTPAVNAIQEDIFVAFQAHLDAYLELLGRYASDISAVEGDNHQPSYLDYRRNNDPAKPMLNSLFGPEWTQTLLDNVLFPQD